MRTHRLPAVLAALLLFVGAAPALAADPNDLVSDHDMTDASSMDLSQLFSFLSSKGGTLAYRYFPDTDGVVKTAAEIIERVATTYVISPKFLLALLQREQSLVEDPSPRPSQFDWATGFAVCDSCSTTDPSVLAWKGFANQVDAAAKQIRVHYLPDLQTKGVTVSGIGPGVTKTIDGTPVTPANKATAVLYTYTPHLHGNINFANIWQRWFSLSFPDGSLVRTADSADIWLVDGGRKRRFASKTAFSTRYPSTAGVLTVSAQDLDAYPAGPEIRFANWSLLRGPDGTAYLLDGDSKRKIASPEVFRKIGFNPDEVEDATADDLAAYADGPDVTIESSYPTGALLQIKTGGVYYVQDGVKHPIPSKAVLDARFPKKPIQTATMDQMKAYPDGDPVTFADGTLFGVKGQAAIYVVEHGMRRPIASEKAFHAYGWQWRNVMWTDQATADLHPLGEPVDAAESPSVAAASATR